MHDFRRTMKQGVEDAVREEIADAFRRFHDGECSTKEYNDIVLCAQVDGDHAMRLIEDAYDEAATTHRNDQAMAFDKTILETLTPHQRRMAETSLREDYGDDVFERRFRVKPAFGVGDKVVHKKFGAGTVQVVDGNKISVQFEKGVGLKKLIADFLEHPFDPLVFSSECGRGLTNWN